MTRPGRMLFAFLAALLLLAAGCDSLPDGEPPAGDLADNTPPPVTTSLALRNHLATQLIAFSLQRGVTRLDPGADPETAAIAWEAARTAGFRLDADAPLHLRLNRAADGGAELVATEGASGAEVWRSRRP